MRRIPPISTIGFCLALASSLALVLSPIGYRLGWWSVRIALLYLVTVGVIMAGIALILLLIAAFRARRGTGKKGFTLALAGVVLSLGFAGVPVVLVIKSRGMPHIHDITTDTENPPPFVALAAARKTAPNGLEYGGSATASQQKQAYPEIMPLRSSLAADQLFKKSESIAHEFGWQVADTVPSEGRIEATDTTLLYGFKDDIAIRIRPDVQGSRLDMRSMSRVGLGDMGVNAARIRKFLARLRESGA